MNPDTMPSWFIDYLEDNTGFNRPGKFGYPYYTTTQESEAVVDFYNFISKPENQDKFPKVAKLIETLKEIKEQAEEIMRINPSERISLDELWVKQSCDDALKPFKKEGE